jgi:thymidylate synthase (FAD)
MSRISLLDHGYVELVEHWGSDERIIEAARMSTGKGFKGWGGEFHCNHCGKTVLGKQVVFPERDTLEETIAAAACPHCDQPAIEPRPPGDEKLLAFLYNNAHMTPFEMAGCIIEVQAPIFVFREWRTHRTQSANEMSSRYTPLPDVNYIPTVERLMTNVKTGNKQAGTIDNAAELTIEKAENFRGALGAIYKTAEGLYQEALLAGIPKELARVHLPVGRYSRMRTSMNLRNWMQFLTLRQATNAQFEIRIYANAVHDVLATLFPRTLALFDEKVK